MNELRYFSGLYPFELLSRNPSDYPDAIDLYPRKPGMKKYSKWVFKALLNRRIKSGNLWRIDDIVLLPAGLMFKNVGSRVTNRAMLSYIKQIQEGKRYGA